MNRRFLERAERLLNRYIDESVSASAVLDELEGRSFHVHVDGLGLDAVLSVDGGRLRVAASPGTAAPDAGVRGTPLDLLQLIGPDMASRLPRSPVSISGRVRVAERFAELLRLALPNGEEALAGWIGDVPAHQLGSAARRFGAWSARALQAMRLNTTEYLTEESRALPTRYEAEAFYAGVERLRDDVERAADRIDRLAERLARPSRRGGGGRAAG